MIYVLFPSNRGWTAHGSPPPLSVVDVIFFHLSSLHFPSSLPPTMSSSGPAGSPRSSLHLQRFPCPSFMLPHVSIPPQSAPRHPLFHTFARHLPLHQQDHILLRGYQPLNNAVVFQDNLNVCNTITRLANPSTTLDAIYPVFLITLTNYAQLISAFDSYHGFLID